MRQTSFKILCLIVWACIVVFSGYSDDVFISLESRILESFNGDDDASYVWRTDTSRFITEGFPRVSYIDAWPVSLFGYARDSNNPLRSFGINGRFDRMGYNWIDVFPVSASDPDGGAVEIPIPGRVQSLDMWVWGANLRYYIEVFLRDYRGVVHTLRLGDISYQGWRNLRVGIPTSIPQARRTLPSYAGLTFVKFRIWTQPVERVDDFYVYFKQLKILTDMYENLFDGNELADPDNVNRLWNN